ncbi:unnamed protein product, partial [Ilex paraguariensis]
GVFWPNKSRKKGTHLRLWQALSKLQSYAIKQSAGKLSIEVATRVSYWVASDGSGTFKSPPPEPSE